MKKWLILVIFLIILNIAYSVDIDEEAEICLPNELPIVDTHGIWRCQDKNMFCLQNGACNVTFLHIINSTVTNIKVNGSINATGNIYADNIFSNSLIAKANNFYLDLGLIDVWHKNGSHTFYKPTANTDVGRGNALKYAVGNSTTSDAIILPNGIYDIGNDRYLVMKANTSLRGSGKYTTIIKSGAVSEIPSNAIIRPSDYTEISDLTIWASSTGAVYQYGLGCIGTGGYKNTIIKSVRIIGNTDGILSYCGQGTSMIGYDIEIYTQWDGIRLLTPSSSYQNLTLYNSVIVAYDSQ